MIPLDKHSGASRARNAGAENSSGEILFLLMQTVFCRKNTIASVNKAFLISENAIVGGTYTVIPYDKDFFSTFQSIFINYSETKKEPPDYIPTHAMVIARDIFMKSGGFKENFLPILEDVEFSHWLRKMGYKLTMNPEILVRHIFNFTLIKSLKNAFRKSMYWTIYSLKNKDLLTDSGTASTELKVNGISCLLTVLFIFLGLVSGRPSFLVFIPLIFGFNIVINRNLLLAFYKTKLALFAVSATLYYTLAYPLAVWAGVLGGALKYFWKYKGSFKTYCL